MINLKYINDVLNIIYSNSNIDGIGNTDLLCIFTDFKGMNFLKTN